MASMSWLGRAKARVQISTMQVTAYHASTTYSLIRNGKSVTTIAQGTVNATASALATAWNASTDPEFAEITASANTDTITFTGDTAGLPFTITNSVSGGTGTIGAFTTTQAATGPNHADDVNNWSGGALPADTDSVYIGEVGQSILYGLDNSSIQPALIRFSPDFGSRGSTVGLPRINSSGYTEDKERYWKIGPASLQISGTSNRININCGTDQVAAEVFGSGQGLEQDVPAIHILGTHASNTLEVTAGSVAVAFYGGDAATFTTAKNANGELTIGAGATIGTLTTTGRTIVDCSTTTTNVYGGETTLRLAGTHGTIVVDDDATLNYESSGTATTVTVGPGVINAGIDLSSRTFTTTTIKRGGIIRDKNNTITFTNKVAWGSDVAELQAI